MPADRAARSRLVAARLRTLPELAGVRRLAAYAAQHDEVDLDAWLRHQLARGTEVYLPWVDGPELRLGRVRDLDADLAVGWRGLREPRHRPGDQGLEEVNVDAAIVPGLGFERTGTRLGQGGGHIDRLLAALRPGVPVVGVAFDLQLLPPGTIPVEPHDRGVDVVVTECGDHRPVFE
jgi:5-formyltetrahydrofolate cyclo-ligase